MATSRFNSARLRKIARRSSTATGESQSHLRPAHVPDKQLVASSTALTERQLFGSGRERREFEKLVAAEDKRLQAVIEKASSQAVEVGRGRSAAIKSMVAARTQGMQALAQAAPASGASYYLIDAPFDIEATGMNLSAKQIAPVDSWAKFKLRVNHKHVRSSLSFYFTWSNPDSRYKVINVDGYIVWHGDCTVTSTQGWNPWGSYFASIDLKTSMRVANWTLDPYPTLAQTPPITVDHFSCGNAGLGVGDIDGGPVFRGYDLRSEILLIPPQTTVGIILNANIDAECGSNSGLALLDFASGAFGVLTPAVLIAVIS